MGDGLLLRVDKGSATVEFFLVIPLLVVVLAAGVGVISVARTRVELLGAVREGARIAATSPDPARAVEAVRSALSPADRDRARIAVSRPAVVGQPARVTARLRHVFPIPLIDDLSVEVTASATMLVER